MIRYKILIEYNGFGFSGWQAQNTGHATIQQTIEHAIFQLTQEKITLTAAGRTDAKVHATAQVAHFDLQEEWSEYKLMQGTNFYLKNKDISIYSVTKMQNVTNTPKLELFHARYSAVLREYTYKIVNQEHPDVLTKHLAWWVSKPLNTNLMQQAANILLGTHDFSSFRASGCYAKSPIKTINSIAVNKIDNKNIVITITAPSFLYHQVRNMVGAITHVGLNKITLTEFKHIFLQKNRNLAPDMAPAHGLYLSKITY